MSIEVSRNDAERDDEPEAARGRAATSLEAERARGRSEEPERARGRSLDPERARRREEAVAVASIAAPSRSSRERRDSRPAVGRGPMGCEGGVVWREANDEMR
jgi:hypothetical protein